MTPVCALCNALAKSKSNVHNKRSALREFEILRPTPATDAATENPSSHVLELRWNVVVDARGVAELTGYMRGY